MVSRSRILNSLMKGNYQNELFAPRINYNIKNVAKQTCTTIHLATNSSATAQSYLNSFVLFQKTSFDWLLSNTYILLIFHKPIQPIGFISVFIIPKKTFSSIIMYMYICTYLHMQYASLCKRWYVGKKRVLFVETGKVQIFELSTIHVTDDWDWEALTADAAAARVTRWVCEKIAPNVAQDTFGQN
jgi:hypothetical protein